MLKIVLDTNVVVSAMLSPGGNPSLILNAVLDGKLLFYYSRAIMSEYEEVLFRPAFGFNVAHVRALLDALADVGILENPPASSIAMADQSDRVFFDVACAVEAFLVTGNLRHYPKESFIVAPAEIAQKLPAMMENG
jgi:putative PIN family toxin of toxin-antitoxin system